MLGMPLRVQMIASAASAHFWLVVRSISNDFLGFQSSLYLVGTPLDDFLCVGISGLGLFELWR